MVCHKGRNVRGLVEGLLGGKLEPQTFITRLQEQLKGKLPASHQLGLVYFLRKWLPSLQDSLAKGELAVEGVTVPEHQEKGGVEENTDINLLKNIPSLLDGSDSHVRISILQRLFLPALTIYFSTLICYYASMDRARKMKL